MKFNITTKDYGIVVSKDVYVDIEHFYDNVFMHESFFITNKEEIINQEQVIYVKELKEETK